MEKKDSRRGLCGGETYNGMQGGKGKHKECVGKRNRSMEGRLQGSRIIRRTGKVLKGRWWSRIFKKSIFFFFF